MSTNICVEVGSRIRFLRKAKGLTLDSFAALVHKSKSIISKYERGDVTIDIVALQEIADALGVSPSSLLANTHLATPIFSHGVNPSDANAEEYYIYSIMSRGKATLQKSFLVLGDEYATCYMNIKSEKEIGRYEYLFTGQVRRSDSFTRILLTNVVNRDDIFIAEIPPVIGSHNCSIAFASCYSIGGYYPIAGSLLLSKTPITDTEWVVQTLSFTRQDLKAFQYHAAYYSVHNFSARILELRAKDD